MKNHIYPLFGHLDVGKIDEVALQKMMNKKSKQNYSMDFIKRIRQLMNQFFEYCVKKKILMQNPIASVIIPKNGKTYKPSSDKALDDEARKKLFDALENEPMVKPIIITLMFTGLRPQELIALKWDNIDFESNTVSITNAYNRVVVFGENGERVGRGHSYGKTKTDKSKRTFISPRIVLDTLEEWKNYYGDRSEFVFPNTKTNEMRTYFGLRALLERFLKRHKLTDYGITLYSFRHTFATMLLEQRENPKIVADLMGHTKVTTTLMIYSHIINSSVYEETATKLNDLYQGLTA
jgi:integrase